jgi:hypothetical protein
VENDEALKVLRRRSWLALRAKIDEQTAESIMLVKLKLLFEERFRYDDEGVPRVWKPDDDIDSIFKKAKDFVRSLSLLLSFAQTNVQRPLCVKQVLSLIPLYSQIAPTDPSNAFTLPSSLDASDLDSPEFDFPASLVLLSETKADDLSTRFRREADAYYLEAKRSMVSSISQIPMWMYAVLAALGWNEFIAIVRSPVYFTFLLLMCGAAYVTYYLNMVSTSLFLPLFRAWSVVFFFPL